MIAAIALEGISAPSLGGPNSGPTNAPRDALRQAHAEAARAVDHARQAEDALARAEAELGAAEAHLGRFSTLDDDVAAHLAARVRAGELGGRGALTPDLVEARRAQAEARQGADDARAAAELLRRERDSTAADSRAAQAAVHAAARDVEDAMAVELMRQTREYEMKGARARMALARAADSRSFNDGPIAGPVLMACREPVHAALVATYGHEVGAVPDLAAWRRRLVEDPEAVLDL